MAKIEISGRSMVIVSSVKLDDIKKMEKYYPDALELKNESRESFFAVGTSEKQSDVGRYGITFADTTNDGDGFACVTMSIPQEVSDVKQYAEEKVGMAVHLLNKVEKQIVQEIGKVNQEIAEIQSNIVVRC